MCAARQRQRSPRGARRCPPANQMADSRRKEAQNRQPSRKTCSPRTREHKRQHGTPKPSTPIHMEAETEEEKMRKSASSGTIQPGGMQRRRGRQSARRTSVENRTADVPFKEYQPHRTPSAHGNNRRERPPPLSRRRLSISRDMFIAARHALFARYHAPCLFANHIVSREGRRYRRQRKGEAARESQERCTAAGSSIATLCVRRAEVVLCYAKSSVTRKSSVAEGRGGQVSRLPEKNGGHGRQRVRATPCRRCRRQRLMVQAQEK